MQDIDMEINDEPDDVPSFLKWPTQVVLQPTLLGNGMYRYQQSSLLLCVLGRVSSK